MQRRAKSHKIMINHFVWKITASLLLALTLPLSLVTSSMEAVIAQAQTTQQRADEALGLYERGQGQSRNGMYQEALKTFQRALVIFRELGKHQSEGMTLNGIGEVYESLEQYAKALSFYQQALAIAKEIPDKKLETTIFNNIGEVYKEQEKYTKALEFYQQALAIAKEIPDKKLEATSLSNIGEVNYEQAEYAKSLSFYQQALVTRKELGEKSEAGLTLISIGKIYVELGQQARALDSYQQALAFFQENRDERGQCMALIKIGRFYNKQRQYPKALSSYQQALAFAKKIPDNALEAIIQEALAIIKKNPDQELEAITLNKIGEAYKDQEKYNKALEVYQQALAIAEKIPDQGLEFIIVLNMGEVYQEQKQYDKAILSYQQTLALAKETPNRELAEAVTLNKIGEVYKEQAQYAKALSFYQQALTIIKETHSKGIEATILNNIGEVYDNLAEYAKALSFYQQALAIRKELGYKSRAGATLNAIGGIYVKLGQYAKALESYRQALAFFKENDDKPGEFAARGYIALAYQKLGQNSQYSDLAQEISAFSEDADYSTWLEFYQQALAIAGKIGVQLEEGLTYNDLPKKVESAQEDLANARKAGNKKDEARKLINLGVIYNSKGQYSKALEFYQQALPIYKEIGDKEEQGNNLNYIGVSYSNQSQYSQALEFFQQALAIRQEIGDKPGEGQTLNNIGFCYNALEKYANAEKTLFDAIEVWESLRSDGLTDDQKVSIFEIQADTYRFLQAALIAQNKTNAALEIAERGRARAFVELLSSKISKSPNNQQIIKPLNIEQFQQIAQRQNATFVEYSINKLNLYIWVIKPTGELIFRRSDLKPLWQQQNTRLTDLVTSSRESIGVRGRGGLAAVAASNEASQTKRFQQLHQLIIEPIADLLPTDPNARVVFIPQESLFLVPFSALQGKDGKYLIEKHTILTAPSIQVLQLTHEQREKLPRTQGVAGGVNLVVGNPTMPSIPPAPGEKPQQLPSLPGAQQEAIAIAPLLNTKAIIGKDATKSAIAQLMTKARIIHLATHGLLDDQRGLGSAIALAPDSSYKEEIGKVNGLLTAEEILDLKLNAELVALSACDTGRGKITGDGVIGLSRSLISAGVPSVLVSLWSVPDAPTAQLMTEFYQNLQKNPDKAQALRQAMLTTMKQHPNPRDWAAFTLIGEAQ